MGHEIAANPAGRGVWRRGSSVRLVALLMLVVAFGHFNRISMSVAGTERIIRPDGVSETRMGMVYSGFLLCYTLAMLPGGWLIDRYGARAALAVLLAGSAVGAALTGLVGWAAVSPALLWGALMVVRCLMGAVNAPLHPGSARLVGHSVAPAAVSLANGLVTFAACVGMAATYFLFGKLIDRFDWPGAFYASSGLTFLVFLAWVFLAPRPALGGPPVAPVRLAALAEVFRHRGLLCLTLSYAALGYFQYLFFYWMQYYFDKVLHLGVERSRLYSTLVVLASGLGMVLGGWLADRTSAWPGRGGRALVPVAGLLGSAVVLAAGLLTTHPELTLVCFALAMAALGMCEGPFWTTAVEMGGRRGGTTAGLMNTGGNAGGLLAPVVTPQLSLYFGWQVGMGLAGLIAVLGAVLWVGIDPRARLSEDES
jgi:MFS transporter, ACS family, D-galactonate transporter